MSDFPLGGAAKSFSTDVAASSSTGIVIPSGTTADSKGAWVELMDPVTYNAFEFLFTITNMTMATGAPGGFLVNLGLSETSTTGDEVPIVENILVWGDNAVTLQSYSSFRVPVRVPAGKRLVAQCQSDSTDNDTVTVLLNLMADTFESPPGYGAVVSYGADEANTDGTSIDAGATANTKGAWIEIVDPCEGFFGFFLSFGGNENIAMAAAGFLFDVGISATGVTGDEIPIAENIPLHTDNGERMFANSQFVHVAIPAGHRIVIRSRSTTNNTDDRVQTVVFHGVK
ncbi:MAG: hypothetical protein V3V40_06340 [Nitrosomonadaceae bacterium]